MVFAPDQACQHAGSQHLPGDLPAHQAHGTTTGVATAQLRQRGMGILLVEQSVAIASEMTDRAYVLSVGKVIHEVPLGGWQAMLSDPSLVRAYLHG